MVQAFCMFGEFLCTWEIEKIGLKTKLFQEKGDSELSLREDASKKKQTLSFTHKSRACSASHSATPQSHEPQLSQAKRGPCLTSAQREKNWLLRPCGSKFLLIGKALHKWEAPAHPRQGLAEAGIILLHQGPSIPTAHHPRFEQILPLP